MSWSGFPRISVVSCLMRPVDSSACTRSAQHGVWTQHSSRVKRVEQAFIATAGKLQCRLAHVTVGLQPFTQRAPIPEVQIDGCYLPQGAARALSPCW